MSLEQSTQLALPKGEWLNALLKAFATANLALEPSSPRSYEYRLAAQRLPIIFQAIRSKEIPGVIFDWDTTINAGFTGTDITAEAGIKSATERNWLFPLTELNPQAPRPQVYLGSTPLLRQRVANPTVADLANTTIYTEYPVLAYRALNNASTKIKAVQGGSEGRWRFDDQNMAVVTIRDTDATRLANEIEIMQDLMLAQVVLVEGPRLSPTDKLRIDDLRELLYRALAAQQ